MLTILQVCFFVGIALTLLSFLLGNLFDVAGMDGLDLDFDIGINFYIPISPTLFLLFLIVFGGVGWILIDSVPLLPGILMIIVAIVAGLFVSSMVGVFVIKPLKKAQNTSSPDANQLIDIISQLPEAIEAMTGFNFMDAIKSKNLTGRS